MPRSAPPTPSAARAERQARKRDRILDSGSRVFAQRPYHLVSMDDVARAAGVGKGTLYRYFPSKEDLYVAIVDEAFVLLIRRLEREAGAGLPPTQALPRMIEAIVETFARHLPFFQLMHEGDARLFLRKKQVIRSRRERIAEILAGTLDRGVESGVFRKVDRALAASMLIGTAWGTTLNHAREAPAAVLAHDVGDLYLNGLLQAPGGPR